MDRPVVQFHFLFLITIPCAGLVGKTHPLVLHVVAPYHNVGHAQEDHQHRLARCHVLDQVHCVDLSRRYALLGF